MSSWLVLSIFALICWGLTGNTQKLSTNYVSAQFSFLGFALAFVPIAILTMLVFPVETVVSAEVLALGILGGVLILCLRWSWRASSCMRRSLLRSGPGSSWRRWQHGCCRRNNP